MVYFPTVLMKLFEIYMFELDINTIQRPMLGVFLQSELLTLHFYEIAYNVFIGCILE